MTCAHRSEKEEPLVIRTCCNSRTEYHWKCMKLQVHPLTEVICQDCKIYEKKLELPAATV